MDSGVEFLELIFSESPRGFRNAYESLAARPYEIFDLLLREERFKNFFSRIEIYGNNLASLLGQFSSFDKYDYNDSSLREIIRVFTLSLLTERFDDTRSRSAIAGIVLSVVKLSDPKTLGVFGVRLGALPEILRILIAEGHIKRLASGHGQCFEGLISEPRAREKWAQFIMDLCRGCEVHRSGPRGTSISELERFIRAIPCGSCTGTSSVPLDYGLNRDSGGEPARSRDHYFGSNLQSNVFKSLLGEALGPWKIILSQQAMENLAAVNAQGNLETVRRKFSELASGDWAGKKILHRARWDNLLSYRIPLFKAFYKTGHFILWQIDAAFDERFGEDYQVIKVWAIGKPQNLDRIGVQVHRAQQVYTKARVEACNRDDLGRSREISYPERVCLDGEEGGVLVVDDTSNGDFDDSAQLAKFYSLTTTVLDNISSTTGKVAYPVDVSAEEAAVVDHFLTPAFILGRSGTGKTTCLVYKLAGRYINSTENGLPLRQVLLTRSKRLVSKLRDNTDGLIEAKLGERKRATEGNYVNSDDFDDNTRKQFSSLTDADFPLVCTFDYLLRLIENSIREQVNRRRYIRIDNTKCDRVIDFVRFSVEYWEYMSPRLKKGIPADLAFLEIMGVIKGSASPATDFEPLSREEYLGKRWRLAPNFASEWERGAVYDIYEWYERTKKKNGDIDQADRIIRVTKALEEFRSSEIFSILDEIYVDEVQDQRTSDIGILLTLVGSPLGIHFAGDTAQCISKDALFRFANAKSLFYERFRDTVGRASQLKPVLLPLSHNFRSHKEILRVASLVMHLLYRGFPDLVDKLPPEVGDSPGPKPTLYIGDNIIDVLRFEKEVEKPRKSGGQSSRFNEYGEVRVVLVRDEETRDKLEGELGRSSLVLTILESKGMEFEDVFLYNFLSTSPYSHKLDILEELFRWRHGTDLSPKDHLGFGGESKLEQGVGLGSGYNTSAHLGGHAGWAKENIALCSELKHLYVGVTRARNRLWILESDSCILRPVRRLFNQTATLLLPREYPGPILEILTEQDIGVSELHRRLSAGRTISASRWREMGYQRIDDRQYSRALRCFEDAKDPHGIALANAYITEEIGLTKRARGSFEAANRRFMEASDSFLQAGSIAKAVQCRKEGGDPKGAVRILADNGAYEDAAWLAADAGLFSETSEIYTKLNKHERALAGYARGKQFKWMLNYLRRFESEIEPCCWKQYALFGYLTEFGGNDTTPGELEKRALKLIGYPEEQEAVLTKLNLVNKRFEMLSSNRKYMEAYGVGVDSGLLGNSVQLLSDKALWTKLDLKQVAQLDMVFRFLQAELVATNPWPRAKKDGRIHKVLLSAVRRGSQQINSFVKMWEDINRALDNSAWRGDTVQIGRFNDVQTASYVDILVTRSTRPNNELRLPLDNIERALEDLRDISSDGGIPSSAQIYCGVYEMPRQPGEYIVLEWSPLSDNPKPRPPLRPVDIESLRDKILRHILGDIIPPLVSLDEGLREVWKIKAKPQIVPPLRLAEIHSKKVDFLARLCQIFSGSSALVKRNRRPKDSLPRNWDWRFWRGALLEQMEFISPYYQKLEVLFNLKTDLVSREGRYRALCSLLLEDDTTEYRIESAVQMSVGACVSSLLAQYQTSIFLGYKEEWKFVLKAMRARIIERGNPSLRYGSEMVNLVNQFVSETEVGDFPGRFCENIYKVLGALGRGKDSLNFYSASIISLYEELALSLILLIRPYEFLIPESWHRLYLHRWDRKYSSPSALERFRYQQCLAKVCWTFCDMTVNIGRRRIRDISLALRSVTLIVICLINLGTFFPRPREYAIAWRKAQEVFDCEALDAAGIWGLRANELVVCLTDAFKDYGGNDSIRLVRGHEGRVDWFAGSPLGRSGIFVVKGRMVEEKKGHQWATSGSQRGRELSAAHILTAFWKRDARRVVEKIRERKRYLAPRYKYSKNCCLLVDMGVGKNWVY
ncbi:unnamed protein product [Tuber aestivum]|uniref:UvrD-like helicase ATP-binding domain-containing protein n=1 Tax=Tuber aestivum TaxID=59557 RepID=A0A292PMJ1_9PEZI|nr:unnamed protein product [Tuber aestivum]